MVEIKFNSAQKHDFLTLSDNVPFIVDILYTSPSRD